ncbi:hypothetical protein ACUN9Y_13270 [Halomonas sp. V046]|uniref:hypothetical protein n=1 Tax=Halomonas sp. V046 TaxID=3459611 RepID=UPI004043D943
MGNPYFDNSDPGKRFQPGTTAEGEAVDEKFDAIATGLDETFKDTTRALKFPYEDGMPSQEFVATALQRRNRVLGFDQQGNLALVSGFYFRGDWQPNTDYFLNDIVRDPVTTNLYVSVARQTSGATSDLSNATRWYLAVDADTVRLAKIAAEQARDDAQGYARSAQGDEQATRAYLIEVQAAEAHIETMQERVQQLEEQAQQHASSASESANTATQSAITAAAAQQVVTATAQQVNANAQAASVAAADAESVSQRINDTTTMDFLNFELSGPDLIAHFAGYSDASNFTINDVGELEVIL